MHIMKYYIWIKPNYEKEYCFYAPGLKGPTGGI